jgi:peptide/nickel transport system substrate-binding protein
MCRLIFFKLAVLSFFLNACLVTGPDNDSSEQGRVTRCTCASLHTVSISSDTDVTGLKEGGTALIRIKSEPGILLSMFTSHPAVKQIIDNNILEPLVSVDMETGEIIPTLAQSWSADASNTNFTFLLNPEAMWHDGVKLTASDIVFTFNKLTDPAGGAIGRRAFLDVAWVEAVDDLTVVFHLDTPKRKFAALVARVMILPEHIFNNATVQNYPAAKAPVGTGPFVFKKWEPGRYIKIVRNKKWRDRLPHLKAVTYKIVPDDQIALSLFNAGKLDVIPELNISRVSNGKIVSYPLTRFEAIVFNTQHRIFRSPVVRKAIGFLIDKNAIRCSILSCKADIINSPWPDAPALNNYSGFSPAKAAELLKQDGWKDLSGDGILKKNGIKLSFELLLSDLDRRQQRAAAVVQHDLAKAGIKMVLSTVSWRIFKNRLAAHRFDIAEISVKNDEPFDIGRIFHTASIKNGENYGSFSNKNVDKFIDELNKAFDPQLALNLKKKILDQLNRTYPMVFMFRPVRTALIRSSLLGLSRRTDWLNAAELGWKNSNGDVK